MVQTIETRAVSEKKRLHCINQVTMKKWFIFSCFSFIVFSHWNWVSCIGLIRSIWVLLEIKYLPFHENRAHTDEESNIYVEIVTCEFKFPICGFKLLIRGSENSNSEVLFSLNVPPTPYRSSKTLFWIKLQSYTTSNVTPKNLLLYSYCPLLPPIKCCRVVKKSVSRCVSRSLINIEWRQKGIAEPFHSF